MSRPERPPSFAKWAARGLTLRGTRAQYAKNLARLREGFIDTASRRALDDFGRQIERLMNRVPKSGTLRRYSERLVEASPDVWDAEVTYLAIYTQVLPVIAERVYDRYVDTGKSIGRGYQQKADPALVATWEVAATEWVRDEGGALVKAVDGYSHAQVVAVTSANLELAIKEGWSVSRLSGAIEDGLEGIAKYRARRIGRTEVMRAAALGSREGALATGLEMVKVWQTANDFSGERHAEDFIKYAGLHGQRRAMGALYNVGGHGAMYPLDSRLPPGESVNCRCSEIYEPI